ncbi:hypothetical protein G9A89_009767 [Geosiphon pyriformis]|nr:hypothetical protein G9A89_009767 [Geosiphon pyriformis]
MSTALLAVDLNHSKLKAKGYKVSKEKISDGWDIFNFQHYWIAENKEEFAYVKAAGKLFNNLENIANTPIDTKTVRKAINLLENPRRIFIFFT